MDIIFYSMVATQTDDKLNYVFISDLEILTRTMMKEKSKPNVQCWTKSC